MIYSVQIPLAAFALCLLLGMLVLYKNYRGNTRRMFAVFLLGMAVWALSAFEMRTSLNPQDALAWQKIITIATMLSSVAFLHFSYLYTRRRLNVWLLAIGYLELIMVAALYPTNLLVDGLGKDQFGYYPVLEPLAYLVSLSMYCFFIWGLTNFIKVYLSSPSYDERNSYLYVIGGVGCFLLAGFTDLASVFGIPIPPVGLVGNILFVLLASVAILRYHLLDVRFVLSQGMSYLMVSLLIALPYVAIIILVQTIISNTLVPWAYLPLLIILAALLQPVWRWVQNPVDRIFYRERYDYLHALAKFGREAQNITDLKRLGSTLVELMSKSLQSSGACLLLPASAEAYFQIAFQYDFEKPVNSSSAVGFPEHSPLIQWLKSHDEPLFRQDLEVFSPLLAISQTERRNLQEVGTELLVPIKTRDNELVGILILKPKLSQHLYSTRDKQLITTIVSQTAMSLENARLYQELKGSYEQLKSTQDHLVKSERLRALGQMTSGIAHDFNNALTGILGRAQLALDEEKDEAVKRHLKIIEKATLDAAQIVRRLQDFARVRTDQVYASVDLGEVTKNALEIIQPRLNQRRETEDAAVQVSLDISRLCPVRGDAAELKEALVNLLINALEAIPGQGKISIKTEKKNGYAMVSIKDTGVGMSSEVKNRLFEPFFTTKGHKGMGMGTSVAYGIVKRHGGEITVSSKPQKGSTFTISLPAGPPVKKGDAADETGVTQCRSAAILVIDDDAAAREVIFEILTRAGYSVDAAGSGYEGITSAQEKDYDLVITDLGMPDISGRDVAKAIKQIKPDIPVVLITGWGAQINQTVREVDGVISKPFDRQSILRQLEEHLAHATRSRR